MGKVTGFLEIEREQPARREVVERIQDWLEIYQSFPEEKQRDQGARCILPYRLSRQQPDSRLE
jgi:glutamate synthase (NADPH/NADH) small chain